MQTQEISLFNWNTMDQIPDEWWSTSTSSWETTDEVSSPSPLNMSHPTTTLMESYSSEWCQSLGWSARQLIDVHSSLLDAIIPSWTTIFFQDVILTDSVLGHHITLSHIAKLVSNLRAARVCDLRVESLDETPVTDPALLRGCSELYQTCSQVSETVTSMAFAHSDPGSRCSLHLFVYQTLEKSVLIFTNLFAQFSFESSVSCISQRSSAATGIETRSHSDTKRIQLLKPVVLLDSEALHQTDSSFFHSDIPNGRTSQNVNSSPKIHEPHFVPNSPLSSSSSSSSPSPPPSHYSPLKEHQNATNTETNEILELLKQWSYRKTSTVKPVKGSKTGAPVQVFFRRGKGSGCRVRPQWIKGRRQRSLNIIGPMTRKVKSRVYDGMVTKMKLRYSNTTKTTTT